MDAELLPGLAAHQGLGEVGVLGGGCTADFGELIATDIGSASNGFTGPAAGTSEDTANAWLYATHAVRAPHRSALTDFGDGLAVAEVPCLLKAGVGRAGYDLAGAGLITGDIGGAASVGTADDLGPIGDAEAHLGGLRLGLAAAEIGVLLTADIFVTSYQAAATGLITGDMLAAAHMGAGDARAPKRVQACDLGRSASDHLALIGHVLGAGELLTRAGFITRDKA